MMLLLLLLMVKKRKKQKMKEMVTVVLLWTVAPMVVVSRGQEARLCLGWKESLRLLRVLVPEGALASAASLMFVMLMKLHQVGEQPGPLL